MADPDNSELRDPDTADTRDVLDVGTQVEVRNRLDGRWSRGFEITSHVDEGYRIKRVSDGSLLPTTFSADQVRERLNEHENNTWWF